MSDQDLLNSMLASIDMNVDDYCNDLEAAHIEVHHNEILGMYLVPGLEVEAKQLKDGISANIKVIKNVILLKPVHICFGMLSEEGVQQIILNIEIQENAAASIFAHCTFPYAKNIRHEMTAEINVRKNAQYSYLERHVHGEEGGVVVIPRSKVIVGQSARYKTDFDLIRGRVGEIDIDLDITNKAYSVSEVTAKISGYGNDQVNIDERCHLQGEYARGLLATNIALRDRAKAKVSNTMIASAPYAQGHVDCKEIVQGAAVARAVPIVEVTHPLARVTHEAAIGSVDSKQLETLMSRGLSEAEAVELIIQGLLSPM